MARQPPESKSESKVFRAFLTAREVAENDPDALLFRFPDEPDPSKVSGRKKGAALKVPRWRKLLWLLMSSYANADGTNMTKGYPLLGAMMSLDQDYVGDLAHDLRDLGAIKDTGERSSHNTCVHIVLYPTADAGFERAGSSSAVAPAKEAGVKVLRAARENTEASGAKHVARQIAVISEGSVALDTQQQAALGALMAKEDHAADDVISAFRGYYRQLDTSNPKSMKFAAKDFMETADSRSYAARLRKQEAEAQTAQLADIKVRMRSEAEASIAAELAAREAAEREEAEMAEEPL